MSEMVVPEGWFVSPLGDHLTTLTDYTANGSFAALKENVRYYSSDNYACLVRTTDLAKITFKPERFTDKKGYEFLSKSKLIEGDIVVANVGSAGKAYLVPRYRKLMTLALNMYLVKFDENKVNRHFVFQTLIWEKTIADLKRELGTTTLSAINKSSFRALPFFVPPLPEQQKIASILTSVDEVIEKTQSQINKLQDLKKGTMNELLTRGIGHTEFKDSELGRIPKSWEIKELSSMTVPNSSITYGVVQPGAPNPAGIKFIRGGDVYGGKIAVGNLRTISKEISDQYQRTKLVGGELIMSLVGYPGEVAIVPDRLSGANIARQVALIKLDKSVNTKFVMYYFLSQVGKERLFEKSVGSAQQVINLSDLKEVNVVLPTPLEQNKQVLIFNSIYQSIERHESKLQQTQSLKKSLMQDLLTGKVRFRVN